MIDDDRFLRHSLENWDFGVDNTGDLFNPSNQASLKASVDKLGAAHLVSESFLQVPWSYTQVFLWKSLISEYR